MVIEADPGSEDEHGAGVLERPATSNSSIRPVQAALRGEPGGADVRIDRYRAGATGGAGKSTVFLKTISGSSIRTGGR